MYLDLGEWEKAENHLGLSCKRDPRVLNTWMSLAELYSATDRDDMVSVPPRGCLHVERENTTRKTNACLRDGRTMPGVSFFVYLFFFITVVGAAIRNTRVVGEGASFALGHARAAALHGAGPGG